jgi:hypothetical protein
LGSDGKGVGKKADDCFVAFLCFECHELYDKKIVSRSGSGEIIFEQSLFDACMKRTWKRLLEKGVLK